MKSQRSYGFLITKELIFGFQILDLKGHFSASLQFSFAVYFTLWQTEYLIGSSGSLILTEMITGDFESFNQFI